MFKTWKNIGTGMLLVAGLNTAGPWWVPSAHAGPSVAPKIVGGPVLILHDASGPNGWVGALHAQMLANLIGHFALEYTIAPVESYPSGGIDPFRAVFYLGTVFSNALPAALIEDLKATDRTVCWFKYNLWELVGTETNLFTTRYGFRFEHMDNSGFDTIQYKGEQFAKDAIDSELGRTFVTNPATALVPAQALHPVSAASIPYVVHGSNLWYVADSPFSFMSEEDRYLVFCDLLHDILGIDHPVAHRAVLRLEDIDPAYPSALLDQAADVFRAKGIPFAISLIPVHEDPAGLYNQGIPRRLALSEASDVISALQRLVSAGGQIVLHGYTHQYGTEPNPYSALTGDDYEFYRVTLDAQGQLTCFTPVPEDSTAWAEGRVAAAKAELARSGFSAVAWETPHYAASPLDYRVFAAQFERTIQRVLYADNQGHSAGQFFPFIIEQDIYGQRILPENLGNISGEADLLYPTRTVEDLLRAARKNLVVRDGWASAYFHPFLDLADLERLIVGIQALGYTFEPLTTQAPPNIVRQSPDPHYFPGQAFVMRVEVSGTEPFTYQWKKDGTEIPGATSDTWAVPMLSDADLGAYVVVVTGAFGQTTSIPMRVRYLVTPVIESFGLTQGVFKVWFQGAEGLRYYVDYQDFLGATPWTATFPVIGGGSLTNINAPVGGLGARYYRLRVE